MVSCLLPISVFVILAVAKTSAQFHRCKCAYRDDPYPVLLPNCGPPPYPAPPAAYSQLAPPQIQPTISLPSPCIPQPQTISNQCVCQKMVVRAQPHVRTTTVPSVQQFVQTSYRPVFETLHYNPAPQCPENYMPHPSPNCIPEYPYDVNEGPPHPQMYPLPPPPCFMQQFNAPCRCEPEYETPYCRDIEYEKPYCRDPQYQLPYSRNPVDCY